MVMYDTSPYIIHQRPPALCVFRKLALRLSVEQCPGRVGSNVFGDSFRCLIASVHVDAMLGEPVSTLTRFPTPMHLSHCGR